MRTAAARRRRHRRIVSNRIIRFARSQVGNRYTWDGSNPRTGFDCSGYTMWVYRHADVARLPHKAEWQRHVRHMHRITRRQARPGDLIFYRHGNGPAYHVAIYAGRGWQYSATDPQEGVVHQRIYSRSIEFRTDWH